ncbi:autotransporter outer membrane beta-barrel domain-containing protein [Carboxylicivirga taeanensis]|uniref:autotransporter outer membrane beta-barrel domain-containing protein n=1 Tax=Carboxylicivirga taeanensis TaxID=1416875 RepID=UPI003F6DC995
MGKQLLILALLTISCIESYSQIVFEDGYFIDESNKKIECLIKNVDWRNNPTEFEYKLSPNESVQKATIQTVKEFGINNVSKYIRATTNIDRSSEQINTMSSERNPHFKEEKLFLKVLIEGPASLFIYVDGNLTRLFYKLEDSEITQLVYKSYIDNDIVSKNEYFKQQLFLNLKCKNIGLKDIKNIRYSKKDIERVFIKYNECTNSDYVNYKPKQKQDLFNLAIRPGLNYSSLDIQNSIYETRNTDFANKLGIRFGIEAEFILPFNKNKWGIVIEPTYQYYKSEQVKEISNLSGGSIVSKVDYKSIEVPIGVRHYFYLNDKSKLFANISYVVDFSNYSDIKILRNGNITLNELEIKSGRNLAFGIGYKYKDKYSLEMRYNTNRELLSDYMYWSSNYNSLNVIFGISLL